MPEASIPSRIVTHLALLSLALGELHCLLSLPQTVSVPCSEVINNGEKSIEYHDSHVKVCMKAELGGYESHSQPVMWPGNEARGI